MRRLLLLLSFTSIFKIASAQDDPTKTAISLQAENEKLREAAIDSLKPWKLSGIISVNSQQVSLTNWAAGGVNSISVGSLLNLSAKYKKGKVTWDNNLALAYGVIRQGDVKRWWKNDDRIQFTTKFGRQAYKKLYYSALGDFRTQFAAGYNYPNDSVRISNFLAPAYAIAALGLDYKPSSKFSLFVAPFSGKFTIVNDPTLARAGDFGVQKEILASDGTVIQHYKTHREEFGAYLKAMYNTKVMENITFQTTLELFTNYLEVHFGNVDVNWTTLFTFKVNKLISATVSTQLIYDNDINVVRNYGGPRNGTIGPDIQFKEVLSLGLTYNFNSRAK